MVALQNKKGRVIADFALISGGGDPLNALGLAAGYQLGPVIKNRF